MSFWKSFAEAIHGEFIEGQYWHSDKVILPFKNISIIFDNYTYYTTSGGNSYTQIYTRVNAPFFSNDNFIFEVHKSNFFSGVAKVFGAQDVKIGVHDFDKAYIIKANDEFKIKSLLIEKEIRQQIQQIHNLNLQISAQKGIWEEQLPANQYELVFFTEGEVKDTATLLNILKLMKLVIQRLEDINIIHTSKQAT